MANYNTDRPDLVLSQFNCDKRDRRIYQLYSQIYIYRFRLEILIEHQ